MEIHHDIIVVGGGGAGLIAAWRAATRGTRVLLMERNQRPGAKILISGGGRCNITHSGTIGEVLGAFREREARFLKPSIFRFSNDDMIRLVESRGIATTTRENGRIFPATGSAKDVLAALTTLLCESGVELRLGVRVKGIAHEKGRILGVRLDTGIVEATRVVVATGGISYPKTGTTGDGYPWAVDAGHTLVPLLPALAPMAVKPSLPAAWRGVALRQGELVAVADGNMLARWKGDVLFSHEGITGPAALEVSNAAAAALGKSRVGLRYDFFPAFDLPALEAELLSYVNAHRGKTLLNIMEGLLPNRIVPALLDAAGVDPATRGYVLTRERRHTLVRILKGWELGQVVDVPIERGEVTAGGISLDEVDPQTMKSRKIDGLFFAGEILDVAGRVGGYNLQAAFSTGFVAGESAATNVA